ncbi:MAG: cbb3-type cytochrome oxidase assembly protein CcoS [Chitinophagales bacterium]
MDVLFLLIGCSVLVALGFLFAFIWAVKDGQWEDDIGPGVRMLFEDKKKKEFINKTTNHKIKKHDEYSNGEIQL